MNYKIFLDEVYTYTPFDTIMFEATQKKQE